MAAFEITIGLIFVVAVLYFLLMPLHAAGLDLSRGLWLEAERKPRGIVVKLDPVQGARGIVVQEVGISRALGEALNVNVPGGMTESVSGRWVSGKGRLRVRGPTELLFAARGVPDPDRPLGGGTVQVVYRFRMGLVRAKGILEENIQMGHAGRG